MSQTSSAGRPTIDLSQLEYKEHYDAYWIELRYAELGSSRYLLTIQDT